MEFCARCHLNHCLH